MCFVILRNSPPFFSRNRVSQNNGLLQQKAVMLKINGLQKRLNLAKISMLALKMTCTRIKGIQGLQPTKRPSGH